MNEDANPTDVRQLRLTSFRQVVGQERAKEALRIAVDSTFHEESNGRLDDLLLIGPPGVGKSALITVLQHELAIPDEKCTEILAQSITNMAELNSVLLSASDGILFLDEIHKLNSAQQHALLLVMDRRKIFLNSGKQVTSLDVAPFTLIGATTNPEGCIAPLVDRFRLVLHLEYFDQDSLCKIVRQRCEAMNWEYEADLEMEISRRSKKTPRLAIRLLMAARRSMAAAGDSQLLVRHLKEACFMENICSEGLDKVQQELLLNLIDGPKQLNVLASILGYSSSAISKTIEPYLVQNSFIVKDKGMRMLTQKGIDHSRTLLSIV